MQPIAAMTTPELRRLASDVSRAIKRQEIAGRADAGVIRFREAIAIELATRGN